MAAPTRYRRSRHLLCSWDGAAVIFHNYAVKTRMRASTSVSAIVAACEDWQSFDAIAEAAPAFSRAGLRAIVSRLVTSRMLYRSDRRTPPEEAAMAAFAPWNPAAGFFHTATKDVLFASRALAEAHYRARTHGSAPPPPVKRYRGKTSIALPKPPREGQFPEVLLARRTCRRFTADPIPLDDLALILDLTAGIQRWMLTGPGHRTPLKTSPSGGARHPIDVYVLAVRVDGLGKGLYHYAADRHRLDRLRRGVGPRQIARYLPRQEWYEEAAAVVLFAASFDRVMHRYQYARAYRGALVEAGHLCQTFCLTATWRGLAPFCSMALADTAIERDLGLDGVRESVLYAAGVGRADGDAATAFAQRDVAPPPVVPNPVFSRRRRRTPVRR